jgi:alpha-L-fucosidase
MTPYTEWYDNAIRVPGSPSAEFHAQHYGDQPYKDFREAFATDPNSSASSRVAAWSSAYLVTHALAADATPL